MTGPDGGTVQVSTVWQGPTLVRTFTTPDGVRTNSYSLSGNTLTETVQVTSPDLPQALAGVTRAAAAALGLSASHGTLEPGKVADFAIFDIGQPAELAYRIGANPCVGRIRDGRAD